MELKYIVTDSRAWAIFSPIQTHASVARGMDGTPVGAGFCRFIPVVQSGEFIGVRCYGESFTLNLKARIEDEFLINQGMEDSW